MMKNLTKITIAIIVTLATSSSNAELSFAFKSPAFNGSGYSSHVQTIENTETSRQAAIDAARLQAAKDAAAAVNNTNLVKFLNNFESRVYAQLSSQLVNNLFGENAQTSGTVVIQGNTIKYTKSTDEINLTVTASDGSITQVIIPIAQFKF
jgi:DNA integrity scanning protein DisA with diadenylate cyclase activity